MGRVCILNILRYYGTKCKKKQLVAYVQPKAFHNIFFKSFKIILMTIIFLFGHKGIYLFYPSNRTKYNFFSHFFFHENIVQLKKYMK